MDNVHNLVYNSIYSCFSLFLLWITFGITFSFCLLFFHGGNYFVQLVYWRFSKTLSLPPPLFFSGSCRKETDSSFSKHTFPACFFLSVISVPWQFHAEMSFPINAQKNCRTAFSRRYSSFYNALCFMY